LDAEKTYKVNTLDKFYIYSYIIIATTFEFIFLIVSLSIAAVIIFNADEIGSRLLGLVFVTIAGLIIVLFQKNWTKLGIATDVIIKENGELVFKNSFYKHTIKIMDLIDIKTKYIFWWNILAIEFKTDKSCGLTLGAGDGFSEMIKEIKRRNPAVITDIF